MAQATQEISNTFKKKYKKLLNTVGKTIEKYGLIENGDRIMVAVSGGKDSIGMLHLLNELRRKAPIDFEIFAYTLDQGQPGFDASSLEKFYQNLNVEYYIDYEDTYSVVIDKIEEGKTYCSLCSRLRRGILYKQAQKLKANKIALGHHADDAIETLLLNLLYAGRMAAMPPKLIGKDQKNIVIRPLIKVNETDMSYLAKKLEFPIIPCNLCGNQENLQRQRIKAWLNDEEERNPIIKASIKSAMGNIDSLYLWDDNLTDYKALDFEMPQIL